MPLVSNNVYYAVVEQLARTPVDARSVRSAAPPPLMRLPPPRPSRATAQPQRVARYQQVQALHQQGQSILRIAQQLRMARKTVRRYLQASTFPARAPRRV